MILKLVLYSSLAGITVFIGALLARAFNHQVKESPVKTEIVHTLIAFGGGVILSALTLVLIPRGLETLSLWELVISFSLGAFLFYIIEKQLAKIKGKVATLLAMLLDFIPESIVLGAVFMEDFKMATLLAVFIGLQNLPESFNSYREMALSGFKEKNILVIFFFLSFFGVGGALTGHYLLNDRPDITAHLMIFASGGILYLLFQDIVPESKLKNSYITSLGATAGFIIGMISEKVI